MEGSDITYMMGKNELERKIEQKFEANRGTRKRLRLEKRLRKLWDTRKRWV